MLLPQPFEYWDPPDGAEVTLTPSSFLEGEGEFTPKGGQKKIVPVLRIYESVNPPRTAPLNYWDFSGHRIRARLLPLLPMIISGKKSVTLVRQGVGVQTDYEVRLG